MSASDVTFEEVYPALKQIFKRHNLRGELIGGLAREGSSSHDVDIYLRGRYTVDQFHYLKNALRDWLAFATQRSPHSLNIDLWIKSADGDIVNLNDFRNKIGFRRLVDSHIKIR